MNAQLQQPTRVVGMFVPAAEVPMLLLSGWQLARDGDGIVYGDGDRVMLMESGQQEDRVI